MRKSIKSLMAILFVAILSCHLFAADGVVTFVKGKVEVKKGNDWVALNVGDVVKQSEMINTGFQSEAKIKLMESILYLGPVTRVTLSKLASTNDTDKVNVYLTTGSVRSKVNRTETKRVSYTVRTPIAVASVRGTDFSINGPGFIYVSDGRVVVLPTQRIESAKDADDEADDDDEEDDNEEDDDQLAAKGEKSSGSDSSDSEEKAEEKKDEAPKESGKELTEGTSNKPSEDTISQEAMDKITDAETLDDIQGGIEVGKNQSMKVHNSSTQSNAKHNIEAKAEEIMNAVTTESTKPIIDGTSGSGNNSISNAVKPTQGSIMVNINKPPFGSLDVTIQLP